MERIGVGRDGDVFDLGDGTVLRRNRDGRPQEHEAEVMRKVRAAGYPVPEVFSVSGPDLVMEKINGPTLLEDAAMHPWRLLGHAASLARLHRQLHEISPPEILEGPWPDERSAIVHLDFHPGNVMISPGGPVVIDWTNTLAGPAELDTAMTELLLRAGEIPGNKLVATVAGAARSIFHRRYRRDYGELAEDGSWLHEAAELKFLDRNLQPSERQQIKRIIGDF